MTKEEAINWFEAFMLDYHDPMDIPDDLPYEVAQLALTALRGPTREMVERMWGEWETNADAEEEIKDFSCSSCGYLLCDIDTAVIMPGENDFYFYPNCGALMTEEAVDILLGRLEALKDGKDD